ncbi:ECF transporter S component [bacterium]|nr:ECF transporter S component [bacterium]
MKNAVYIARLGLIIALTLVVQIAGLPQPVTGPLINALLFLTTTVLGLSAGLILGSFTPLAALIRGQLPAVLAPMIPFIILGNAVLVFVFDMTRKMLRRRWTSGPDFWAAVILSAAAKFLLLAASVKWMVPLITGHALPAKLELAMTFPQFLTALSGGLIGYFLIRIWKKAEYKQQ